MGEIPIILSWGSFGIPAKSFICELKIFNIMYLSHINHNNTELNTHIMFLDTQEIPDIKKKNPNLCTWDSFGIPGKKI